VIRVVVDPGVFISVLIGPGGSPPDRVFDAFLAGKVEVVFSPALLAELRRVAFRPKFRRWFDEARARELIERLDIQATMLEDPPAVEGATPDPDDDYLIALAHASNADAIVSGDSHVHAADLTVLTPRQLADQLPEDKAPASPS